MTYSVYQHWDPLQVCIVGRSYPPEFYAWIKIPAVRSLFEKIATETEEDYQNIICKLESFGVKVFRPDLPKKTFVNGQYVPPPMTPRDHTIMIGNVFYENVSADFVTNYQSVKDPSWPNCKTVSQFHALPLQIQKECLEQHQLDISNNHHYKHIFDCISAQGNQIKSHVSPHLNGAMVSRIGKDLYFGTPQPDHNPTELAQLIQHEFTHTRNHIVDTKGHSDGTYCPVAPGLIISLTDVPTYKDTYPGWEVVYLPHQSWSAVKDFLILKQQNQGRWWIPGFEHNADVVNTVEQWLGHWTGYVEETVFDVNMLIVDPKNVLVFNYNKQVFDALDRYGITAHVVPFRHRYFWDGGIHCVTSDLHRSGHMKDYFSERS
jgi:hypothetical protein